MSGRTHMVGGVLACLTGYSLLYSRGMLLSNVSPLVQLAVMYPFAIYGSKVSDLDHDWNKVPCKDVFSWFLWRFLHLTTPIARFLKRGGKCRKWVYSKTKGVLSIFNAVHRSWQTHSDLFVIFTVFLSVFLMSRSYYSADLLFFVIMAEGLLMGILSHLALDMLTPDGIWSFLLTPIRMIRGKDGLAKLHLVPNWGVFTSDSEISYWERLIRKLMWLGCFILVFRLVYLYSPYRIGTFL